MFSDNEISIIIDNFTFILIKKYKDENYNFIFFKSINNITKI